MQFRFVNPTDTGGLPIEAYAVEYKEAMQNWNEARRRVWPQSRFYDTLFNKINVLNLEYTTKSRKLKPFFLSGLTGEYILENLIPKTTYDFRFGSKNLVGFSDWGAARQLTMPARGPPEPPRIETNVSK